MKTYNQIMLYFWLVMAILTALGITYLGFKEGFNRWYFYYIFSGLALLMFIMKRFLMKKMEKHQAFLDSQNKENQG